MPLGKEVGLGPGHIVLDGDPVGTNPLPTFWPMFIVANRSPISATAELLLSGVRSRSRSPNFLKPWSPGVGVGVGVPQENKDSASLLVTKAFSQDRHCSHSRFPGILVPCLCLTCTILPIHMGVLWNFFSSLSFLQNT